MAHLEPKQAERCLLMQLWGLDTPITALCWAVACAALMQITMITAAPMLLVAAGVWCAVIVVRLRNAWASPTAWQAGFYRRNMALLLVLLLSVGMAALWILLFQVGRSILGYLPFPVCFYYTGLLCRSAHLKQLRLLLHALAFAMVCTLPAFYFSFSLSPLDIFTTGPVWYMGILFYLMARERERLRNNSQDAAEAVVNTVGLIMLLVVCLLSSVTAPMFERTLCITLAIGAGCLQGFTRISSQLSQNQALALSWLSMALPAVLGTIIYAPHGW